MKRIIEMIKRNLKGPGKKVIARVRYGMHFCPWRANGKWVLRPDYEPLQYDAVNLDINNTCNLRCRFCFNVFEKKHSYMTKELFEKVLPIISMTKTAGKNGTGVYLSCLYEPSLSPHFLEFLEMLPKEARHKAFLTTNLCRPWDIEKLKRLLSANLHHINISIETLDRQRHEEISGSKHFDCFYENLNKLSSLYPLIRGYRPKLRFITMILKINRDEITDIVKYCSKKLYASQHELRTPYISVYENMAWNREQLMEPEECEKVRQELAVLRLPMVMDIHSREELIPFEAGSLPEDSDIRHKPMEVDEQEWERQLKEAAFCMHQEFFFIRFHSSGMCTLNVTKDTFSIADLKDPAVCYREKLKELYMRRSKAFYWEKGLAAGAAQSVPMRVMLEDITANEMCLTLRGWYRVARKFAADRLPMITVEGEEEKRYSFFLYLKTREDLEEGAESTASGFSVCIGRQILPSKVLKLEFCFVDTDTMEKSAVYEYPYTIIWK